MLIIKFNKIVNIQNIFSIFRMISKKGFLSLLLNSKHNNRSFSLISNLNTKVATNETINNEPVKKKTVPLSTTFAI